MNSNNNLIKETYKIFDRIKFSECIGCSFKCCYLPWLLKEEYEKHFKGLRNYVMEVNSVFFVRDLTKCKFVNECKCNIYSKRPLDCRLFPLDIIEEDGKFYWCIFTVCPKHAEIRKKLIPLIHILERFISKKLFLQYKKQIAVSKEFYLPYKLKQYEKIKLFEFQ